MTEPLERARQLAMRVDPAWQPDSVEAQLAGLRARQRVIARRRAVAAPAIAATMAAVLVLGVWAVHERAAPPIAHRDRVAEASLRPPAPLPAETPAPAPAVVSPPVAAERAPDPSGALAISEPAALRPRTRVDVSAVRPDEVPAAVEPPTTWREYAERGDYAAAWTALEGTGEGGRPIPIERMPDLLLAGDVARLSGHPAAAVRLLARAVASYPGDPRAPLAAFTLGRVQLEELGAPRSAAAAFSQAFALAPDGPLAEDALAREVEAWSRCGETDTAYRTAVAYLRRYPDGRRARAVRHFGGLERR